MKTKLKLTAVKVKLPFDINKGLSLGYMRRLKDENFDFEVYLPIKNKILQRGLVWSDLQKSELILSILKGIKIPVISVVQFEDDAGIKTLRVIDGKQRLTTIIDYINGKFPIVFDNQEYYIDDLEDDVKRNIMLFQPTFDVLYDDSSVKLTDEEKETWYIKWFELLNFSGTVQDKQHLDYLKQ